MHTITPDAFLARYPPAMQAICMRLRALVRGAVPGTIEQVKLGWKLIGLYVPGKTKPVYYGFILPHETSVSFGFEYGVLLDDASQGLLGAGEALRRVRYISLKAQREIKVKELRAFTRQAAQIALMPRGLREAWRLGG